MKIAIACLDEQTVSPHFGRAEKYVVYSVESGKVINREVLPKSGHREFSTEGSGQHRHQGSGQGSGLGRRAKCQHEQMVENIRDCDVVLARGMGRGAYQDLQKWGIKPIITDISDLELAVQAVLAETIVDHTERLH